MKMNRLSALKLHRILPLFLREDWWTFVLCDLSIVMNADDQFCAQRLRLSQRICVSEMHHVVAADGKLPINKKISVSRRCIIASSVVFSFKFITRPTN